MQNGQLWPSIWHHLRHPLVAELRRWGWRNSSTPLDTLSNNEGYPNHWFTRPHDWILCSPKDWYEQWWVPWISTTSNWPCSACLVAHVDIDWIPGYALISFSSSLPTLCPVQLSFTELIGLIFFAICGCFFIRKPNGGFSYHPIFVSVFKLFFSGQIGPETHPVGPFSSCGLGSNPVMSRPGHKVPWHTRGWTWFERKLTGHHHFFGGKAWKKRGKNMVYAWSAADFPLSLPSDLSSTRTAGLRFRLLCNIVVPSPGTDASKVN